MFALYLLSDEVVTGIKYHNHNVNREIHKELTCIKKLDLKQRMREVRFTTEYTLTPEQREKLIQEKLERARLELETRKRVENQLLA